MKLKKVTRLNKEQLTNIIHETISTYKTEINENEWSSRGESEYDKIISRYPSLRRIVNRENFTSEYSRRLSGALGGGSSFVDTKEIFLYLIDKQV